MENKRKYTRVMVQLQGAYSINSGLLLHGARVKDISQNGICLQLKQHVPVGSLLKVEICSNAFKVPLRVVARVVRISASQNPEFAFESGLELLEMPPDDRESLDHFVLYYYQRGNENEHW